jgi:hypothetical protein
MNRIVERLYRRIGLEFVLRWRKLGLLYLVKVGRLLGLNWMLRLCLLYFWKRQLHSVVLATAVVSACRVGFRVARTVRWTLSADRAHWLLIVRKVREVRMLQHLPRGNPFIVVVNQ